jgi:paraquat-inducible protein B
VLGGVALAATALVLFSSQDLFSPRRQFVAYFQQSVNGLNVGAPVKFKGIPVGEVLSIEGVYDPETGIVFPRVTFEFRPETLTNAKVEEGEYTLLPLLLKQGLRVSLKSQSILTGQVFVAMDFHPQTPERRLGNNSDEYPELPTVDSGLEGILAKVQNLPIEEIMARLGSTLKAAEDLLRDPNITETLEALPLLLRDADLAVVDLNRFVSDNLTVVATDASQTLVSARGSIEALANQLTSETLVQSNNTLVELESLMSQVRQRLALNDPLMYELLKTLRDVRGVSRSMRELSDYLEEHPESLIRGKTDDK